MLWLLLAGDVIDGAETELSRTDTDVFEGQAASPSRNGIANRNVDTSSSDGQPFDDDGCVDNVAKDLEVGDFQVWSDVHGDVLNVA